MGSGILCAGPVEDTRFFLREQSLSSLVREAPSRLVCITDSCRVSSLNIREHRFLNLSRLYFSMSAKDLKRVYLSWLQRTMIEKNIIRAFSRVPN